jgi:hypothetical protein
MNDQVEVRPALEPCPLCADPMTWTPGDLFRHGYPGSCPIRGIGFNTSHLAAWNTRHTHKEASVTGGERVEQAITAWAFANDIDGAARNDLMRRVATLSTTQAPDVDEVERVKAALDKAGLVDPNWVDADKAARTILAALNRAPVDVERGLAEFTRWFVRNYPGPSTVIANPHWHVPKIFRAAIAALASSAPMVGDERERADLRAEIAKIPGDFPNYGTWDISLPAGHWRALIPTEASDVEKGL